MSYLINALWRGEKKKKKKKKKKKRCLTSPEKGAEQHIYHTSFSKFPILFRHLHYRGGD